MNQKKLKPKKFKQKLIGVDDLCSTLGIKRTKAYKLIADQSVESIKIGRRRLIIRSSVKALVKRALHGGDA